MAAQAARDPKHAIYRFGGYSESSTQDFAEGLEKAYIVHFANARNRLELINKYIATEQSQVQKVTV